MAEFRLYKPGPVVSRTVVRIRNDKSLFFQSDWQDIDVLSLAPEVLQVTTHPVNQRNGISGHLFQLTLTGGTPGSTSLLVRPGPKEGAKQAQPCKLEVEVMEELMLPPEKTDVGILARVILHEVNTPDFDGLKHDQPYVFEEAVIAMNYVRNVIENRRNRRYDLFGFTSQPTLEQVIHPYSQFGAFGRDYPKNKPQMRNITDAVDLANNDSAFKQVQYAKHVAAAIRIATAPQAAPDPSRRGLYFWRTKGAGSPSSYAEHFRDALGLSFYTLTADVDKPRYGAKP